MIQNDVDLHEIDHTSQFDGPKPPNLIHSQYNSIIPTPKFNR